MILLSATTDKMQVVTSAAGDVDVIASYVDRDQSSFIVGLADRQLTTITAAATTDVLAAPSSGKTRNLKQLTVRNTHASIANDILVQFNANATLYELHKVTLQPGEMLEFIEGVGFITLAAASTGFGDILERRLDATQTGTNGTGAQNWFPTNGAVNVEAGVVYEMEGVLNFNRAAGAVSHTTSLLFAGTATLTYILWRATTNTGDTLANAALNHAAGRSASAVVVKAASTGTTEETSIRLEGSIKVNAAGTFIPQFQYSAAPGGAPTIQIGSFFQLVKKGAAFNTKGTWS